MGKVIAYARASTESQDLEQQVATLNRYAISQNIKIDKLIEVNISSRKSKKARKIDELFEKLEEGDLLLVTELSRLSRSGIADTLAIVDKLNKKGVKIAFVTQPELSTSGDFGELILAVYSHFAQANLKLTSERTKNALRNLKEKGVKLGRKKGTYVKSKYDDYRDDIIAKLKDGVPQTSIYLYLKPKMGDDCSVSGLRKHILNRGYKV